MNNDPTKLELKIAKATQGYAEAQFNLGVMHYWSLVRAMGFDPTNLLLVARPQK